MNIAVLGGGSWATALVKILTDNAQPKKITWWMRSDEQRTHLITYKHNPTYLSSVSFDMQNLHVEGDLRKVLTENEIIIFAIPSAFLYDALAPYFDINMKDKILVSAIKGVIPQTHQLANHFFEESFLLDGKNCVAITGPCHAEEVALERLSYLTIASGNIENAELVSKYIQNRFIKTYLNDDIDGTEFASVLKNIYAVMAGICHGQGYGDNFHAVLVSAALREMDSLLDVLCPMHRDVKQSAYLGDLLVTAYSMYSRNRTFGHMIGKGYRIKDAQMEMNMIAEGYYATKSVMEMLQNDAQKFPILEATYQILYQNKLVGETVKKMSDKLF